MHNKHINTIQKEHNKVDVKLTDRKFSLLSRRSQDWCTHPGSWGPKRRLFQSGELPAISLPVRWTRSPSCSKPRQSQAVFLWLLSNKPGGEGRKRKGRKQTWLVEKYILEHPGVANFFSLGRTLLPLRLKRLVSVFVFTGSLYVIDLDWKLEYQPADKPFSQSLLPMHKLNICIQVYQVLLIALQ